MNISTGLSDISFTGAAGKADRTRFFVWPEYNAGNVAPVRSITPRHPEHQVYHKLQPAEAEKAISSYFTNEYTDYNARGSLVPGKRVMDPGTLFDARA
jgi:hypothetical protein